MNIIGIVIYPLKYFAPISRSIMYPTIIICAVFVGIIHRRVENTRLTKLLI